MRQAIVEMGDAGLIGGTVRLERTDRMTGHPDVIEIQVSLPDLAMAHSDLLAIGAGQRSCGLGPPPADIALV